MVIVETIRAGPDGKVIRVKEKLEGKEKEFKSLRKAVGQKAEEMRKFQPPQKYRGRLISREKSRKVGRAVTGILGALLPQEAMAGSVSYAKKGTKSGDGRGRPRGTFKARYLPDGRVVRVPTHIYRRMLSEYKAKRRLVEAQKQAKMQEQYEAEQISSQQRAGYEQPDAFAEAPDMDHEARVARIREQELYQQQLAQQPRPSILQRTGRMVNQIGAGVNQITQEMQRKQALQQQRIAQRQMEQGDQPQNGRQIAQQFGRPTSSQIRILSNKSSILNAPNVFNNPGNGNKNHW